MKKALLISYFFPPSASTGALRPMKFVKYLPHFGWLPIVLSCKNPFDFEVKHIDLELLKELPDEVKVFRTTSFEPLNLYWSWKNTKVKENLNQNKKRKNHTIKNLIYDILRTPDNYHGWIPFAFFRGLIIEAKENFDVILATAPPVSALLVGYLLSKFTKKPLIVDYRDPWKKQRNLKFLEKITKYIEKIIIKHACYIISVTDTWSKELQNEYSDNQTHKYIVIPNGYDLEELNGNKYESFNKLTFLHAGQLYNNDGVADFIDSVFSIIQEHPNLTKVLKILFIGDRPVLPKFDILEKLGVANFKERVPRKECLNIISKAHVLLVFLRNNKSNIGCIPAKLFDYMMFKKPILGIFSEGEAKDLIERANLGVVIGYNDKQRIKHIIYDFYEKHKNKNIKNDFNEEFIKKYDRKELTRKLSNICEYITNHKY